MHVYNVDERDRVVELEGAPQSSIGAPLPLVIADEWRVMLAYYLENRDPDWDGTSVRVFDRVSSNEPLAIITFNHAAAHLFGPPNDEAFEGHPLAKRGLHPYGAFKIENSSWIRGLERMNSVHPCHKPERYNSLQHVIFSFHDSMFECACESFEVRRSHGSIHSAATSMLEEMFR